MPLLSPRSSQKATKHANVSSRRLAATVPPPGEEARFDRFLRRWTAGAALFTHIVSTSVVSSQVLGAVFDTLDEHRAGALSIAELQRVGFKTASMASADRDSDGVDRETFVGAILDLLGKRSEDAARLLPEAVALCGRVFRLRATAAVRAAAERAAAEAEERADVARHSAKLA